MWDTAHQVSARAQALYAALPPVTAAGYAVLALSVLIPPTAAIAAVCVKSVRQLAHVQLPLLLPAKHGAMRTHWCGEPYLQTMQLFRSTAAGRESGRQSCISGADRPAVLQARLRNTC